MKKHLMILIYTLFLLSFTACGPAVSSQWQEQYNTGVKHFESQNYTEAVTSFINAINTDPSQAQAYQKLAETYSITGNTDMAQHTLLTGIHNTTSDNKEIISIYRLFDIEPPAAVAKHECTDDTADRYTIVAYDENDQPIRKIRYYNDTINWAEEYDAKGNLTSQTAYTHSGFMEYCYIHSYDENGKLTGGATYDSMGSCASSFRRNYSTDSRLTSVEYFNGDGTPDKTDEYNENEMLIRSVYYDDNGNIEVADEYNEYGLIRKIYYNTDGSIKSVKEY